MASYPDRRERLTPRGIACSSAIALDAVIHGIEASPVHTDEKPIKSTQLSTLDTLAIPVPNGDAPIVDLKPVHNAGLGLARAIAVANALASELEGTGARIGAANKSTAHLCFCLGLNTTLCPLVIWGGRRSAESDRMRADRIDQADESPHF